MNARQRERCEWIVPGVRVRCNVRELTYDVKETGSERFIANGPEGQEVFDYGPNWAPVK